MQNIMSTPLGSIAEHSRDIGCKIEQIASGCDPANTVILIGENHYSPAEYLFEIGVISVLAESLAPDVAMEIVAEDMQPDGRNLPNCKNMGYRGALKALHRSCSYPFAVCAVPAYVLNRTNLSCAYIDKNFYGEETKIVSVDGKGKKIASYLSGDDFAETESGMTLRDSHLYGHLRTANR